ncbi:hypothetical protein L6164_016922 [Bauhinia variegata]|uniref:Uncharacterized protein n=1 Tax=Bauhinia variegata TaxID=167791 RepID=A0ACB9N657_BAUVA|nr:hypothetical protein L6164_016922 [Bauhinia variegata]
MAETKSLQEISKATLSTTSQCFEAIEKVASGKLNSVVAIVRPPGHHVEQNEAMGFCLFNNVAAATSFLLNEKVELGVKKILIVDWDVHYGNSTQKMFWKDSRVLFFSIHRHEFGSFYPANHDGTYSMIGEGPGFAYNINVVMQTTLQFIISHYSFEICLIFTLMNYAQGRIVLVLEGGYNLDSIAKSMVACVKVIKDTFSAKWTYNVFRSRGNVG